MSVQHDPQLLKGLVGLLVLAVLRNGESYGYAITSQLRELGLHDLKEGTVYPALSRLEKDRLVSTRLVESTSGPARKYYALTRKGKEAFETTKGQWQALASIVDDACA